MSLAKDFLIDVTVAAAGTNQATAAALTKHFNVPTAASTDGTKGVTLPAGAPAGTVVYVRNRSAGANNLNVYSATSGGTIDATAGSTANTIAQAKSKLYLCVGNDVWWTLTGA